MKFRKFLALCMVLAVCGLSVAISAQGMDDMEPFTIINPYANVNWDSFGQYKAALHVHTNSSDGRATLADTIRDHYNKGFDILAVTDHDVLLQSWNAPGNIGIRHQFTNLQTFFSRRAALSSEAIAQIYAGTYPGPFPGDFNNGQLRRQQQNGMISLPNTNEQSRVDHTLTYWAPFNNSWRDTTTSVLRRTQQLGGIAVLAHPGRYTGGRHEDQRGLDAVYDPEHINRYVNWFLEFDAAVGMEMVNRLDRESRRDRIFWDNLLMQLMPYGRPVWGFSNDDSHALNEVGYNFNIMLLPELTADATRVAMETGAFYAVTRVARLEGVNAYLPDGTPMPLRGGADTLFLLDQPTPRITNIATDDFTITIAGTDYDRIEWIASGRVIYTGNTLDLRNYRGYPYIGHNYVRAQLVSETGIAMTQPFGIWWGGTYPAAQPVVATTDTWLGGVPLWLYAVSGAVYVLVLAGIIVPIVLVRRKK
ncbi:MAG: hypothetical protein FWD06_02375 [Oscillospiraceae bacterium]|nr:hypothetical protein [Oscillospiraceae bacterium]